LIIFCYLSTVTFDINGGTLIDCLRSHRRNKAKLPRSK